VRFTNFGIEGGDAAWRLTVNVDGGAESPGRSTLTVV